MTRLIDLPVWRELRDHQSRIATLHLRDLFAAEPDRGAHLAVEAAGLYVDYSKHRITAETLRLLLELERWRDRMFAGEAINASEDRPAWHVALRSATPPQEVGAALARMRTLVDRAHRGNLRGVNGRTVRTVVNLGIGGSDLGPRMATRALRALELGHVATRFVANVD